MKSMKLTFEMSVLIGVSLLGNADGLAQTLPTESPTTVPATRPVADGTNELSDWLENYYLQPEPERVSWAMDEVVDGGLLEDDGARAAVVGFFAQLFAANSQSLSLWFPPENQVFADHRVYFYSALWQANSMEARAILDEVEKVAPADLKQQLKRIRARDPRPVHEMPVTSPARLDMMWGSFFATGDSRYIDAIVAVLQSDPKNLTAQQSLIRISAVESLSAHAQKHKQVFLSCKAHLSDKSEFGKADLESIVRDATDRWEVQERD